MRTANIRCVWAMYMYKCSGHVNRVGVYVCVCVCVCVCVSECDCSHLVLYVHVTRVHCTYVYKLVHNYIHVLDVDKERWLCSGTPLA